MNKSSYGNKRITLDAKHNEILKKIKDEQSNLPTLKNNLKDLLNQYNQLKQIPKKELSIDQFNYKYQLKKNIIELKDKIKTIKNNDSLNDYYLKVGDLLYQYYDNIDNIANEEQHNDENNSFIKQNKNNKNNQIKKKSNVLDFFNTNPENNQNNNSDNNNNGDNDDNDGDNDEIKEMNYTNTKISDFVTTTSNFKRTHILNDYLKKVDDEYNCDIIMDNNVFKCPDCDNQEMVLLASEGIQICKKCGLQQSVLIESDKPSFKDPPPEICYFSYKRINHLNEYKLSKNSLLFIVKNIFYIFYKIYILLIICLL